jgi:hypothetical protein
MEDLRVLLGLRGSRIPENARVVLARTTVRSHRKDLMPRKKDPRGVNLFMTLFLALVASVGILM